MEYIITFLSALSDLSNAMSPYILFGLLFAGVLHELIPDTIVTKHLGKANITSVIKSTLFGVPLPVCSCGVIPLVTSIKKSGASKGATLSFLISTPITGVDSILATYGIFGSLFTLYRVVTSMFIAMVAGVLTNYLDKEEEKSKSAFSAFQPANAKPTTTPSFTATSKKEQSCCSNTASCCSEPKSQKFSLKKALKYGFITLLGDIAKPLFWGLIIGTLITVIIPQNLSEILVEYSWLSYLIVIIIAVPMYVCATASLPIAAALMLSGVSAGAAFVFLSAGPATNTVTIGVVRQMLGKHSLYIYLGTIIIGSVVFGAGLDYLFSVSDINPGSIVHIQEEVTFFSVFCSFILWGFITYFISFKK